MIYFKNFLRAKTLHTKNVAACNGFSITEPPHSFGTEGLHIFCRSSPQKTAYEISLGLVGSEMCIRDRSNSARPRSDFLYTKNSARPRSDFLYTKNAAPARFDFIYTKILKEN